MSLNWLNTSNNSAFNYYDTTPFLGIESHKFAVSAIQKGKQLYFTEFTVRGIEATDPKIHELIKTFCPETPLIASGLAKYGYDKFIYADEVHYIDVKGYYSDEVKKSGAPEKPEPNYVSIEIASMDKEVIEKLRSELSKLKKTKKNNKGKVYVLITENGCLTYTTLGLAGVDFIQENYNPETAADFQYVSQELNKEFPNGRIALFNGPPGTGKTFAIRALLNSVPGSTFLIIPSNMVESLGGPDFMGFFIQNREDFAGPLVLIIEDGDRCLTTRMADNASVISTLLNSTDGIIGHLLDFRVVITTNIKIDDVDPAVMRPGRLLQQIEFDKLKSAYAEEVFLRLTGKYKKFEHSVTLAEVYALASGNEKAIAETKKHAMGFGS